MTVTTTRQSFQKTAANRSHAITVAAKFLRTNMLYVGATCVLTTASVATGQGVDSIYDTGSILTLAGKDPACVEALAVKDGKIIFTESKDAGLKMKGDSTKVVDLSGKTLLPRLTRRTQPIQQGYKLKSLSASLGQPAPSPAAEVNWPVRIDQVDRSADIFRDVDFLLAFTRPHPLDQLMLDRIARIGIAPANRF